MLVARLAIAFPVFLIIDLLLFRLMMGLEKWVAQPAPMFLGLMIGLAFMQVGVLVLLVTERKRRGRDVKTKPRPFGHKQG